MTEQMWLNRAALYEILALGLNRVKKELAEVVYSGEYADALEEIADVNELDAGSIQTALDELWGSYGAPSLDTDQEVKDKAIGDLFHSLRIEYTHLFVGAPEPVVSPYAGVWWAKERGVEPLLFVNQESMAVERFMRSCGIGQQEGTNDPLDNIAAELEFLQYLCLINAGVAKPFEGVEIPENAYEDFLVKHFEPFVKDFAPATIEAARIPFYRALARVLLTMVPAA